MSAGNQLSPPEHFNGKLWRCWLCGAGFFGEDWGEYAVYRTPDEYHPNFDAGPGEELFMQQEIRPVYLHYRCLDAVHKSNPDLAKRIME